jgi:hypothetical protein
VISGKVKVSVTGQRHLATAGEPIELPGLYVARPIEMPA